MEAGQVSGDPGGGVHCANTYRDNTKTKTLSMTDGPRFNGDENRRLSWTEIMTRGAL